MPDRLCETSFRPVANGLRDERTREYVNFQLQPPARYRAPEEGRWKMGKRRLGG